MKRYLPLLILAASCGSEAIEPISSQAQEATTTFSVYNGSSTIAPWHSSSKFCLATYFGASGGAVGAPLWPIGLIPKIGYRGGMLGTIHALPYDDDTGESHAYTQSRCWDKSNFGITGGSTDLFNPPQLLVSHTTHSATVNTSIDMWNGAAFCHIGDVNSLNTTSEAVYANPTAAGIPNWKLGIASGKPTIGVKGACVHPNRPFLIVGPFTANPSLTTAQTVVGPPTSQTVCFFTRIQGNLDEYAVEIHQVAGRWNLTAHGHAVSARMHCAQFTP
jgi:hypothetical protein